MALCLMAGRELQAIDNAGTFYLGVKAWGALWDSPYIKVFARELERTEVLLNIGTNSPLADNALWRYRTTYVTGRGYLAGPIASYQTPDRRWTISVAVMWLNYFTAEYREKLLGDTKLASQRIFTPLSTSTRVKLQRNEVDSAVSAALNDYVKLFAGYKYQRSTARATMNLVTSLYRGNYLIQVHLPTAGVALSYPVTRVLALSLQAGFLYSFPELRETGFKSVDRVYASPGMNAEGGFTIMPVSHFIIQIGYRAQLYEFRMRKSNAAATTIALQQYPYTAAILPVSVGYKPLFRELDLFHGLTMAVVAYF